MVKQNINLKQIDSLDFRNNKVHLILSYILRFIGVIIFGFLFLLYTIKINGNGTISLEKIINIDIQSVPAIVSIVLLILDVVFVLFLHELIHAFIFYITHKQRPKIGVKGLIIFAAAPNKKLTKAQYMINAIAPFMVITLFGLVLILILPQQYLSWIFIPTVVNAAAAGGDFIAVIWALKKPKHSIFIDIGDITKVFIKK